MSFLLVLFIFFIQRSTEQMRKVPTIVLSITYKGVKFIDAANKVSNQSSLFNPACHVTHYSEPEYINKYINNSTFAFVRF